MTVALDETEKTIRAYLREPKIAYESIYTAVGDMLDRGEPQEAVLAFLKQTTNAMHKQEEGVMGFNAVYGYIRGEFLDGGNFELGEDYVPQQRPWYQLAVRNDGAEYTAPYLDEQTEMMIMSLAREIYGAKGDYYGVLTMDVDISWLMEYAETLQFAKGGYGMIINQFIYVIAHPQEKYRNMSLQDLGEGYSVISKMLRMNNDVSAVSIKDIDKKNVITFFKQLYNGWYVGVVMPSKSYYADLYFTAFILIALGIGLMIALNLILLRFSADKIRSEEENKSKTTFLARMSHEIRTPMNAILGMAELALREDIPDTTKEHILAIKQSGANLLSIINDILDFSKIESGKLEIVSRNYLFASLINDVINIIRMRVMDTNLQFITNIDSHIPNMLIGDEIRIRQIFLNLLSNAVKYTEEGFVSLSVSCKMNAENTVTLTIEVADSGRGIKEEDMEKLFGDFVQIDLMKNKGIEGTGLGLAITRSLLRAMGGDITVSSEYGRGSRFTIEFLQECVQYEKLANVECKEKNSVLVYEQREKYAESIVYTIENLGVSCTLVYEESEFYEKMINRKFTFALISSFLYHNVKNAISQYGMGTNIILLTEIGETITDSYIKVLTMPVHPISVANILNGISDNYSYRENKSTVMHFIAPSAKILIVDDVDTNLKVAEGLMLPYNMQIDLCKSGPNAITAVLSNRYDLILMDHMMPEMDGVETTKRIRALDVDYSKSIPIIALTANAVSSAREMFMQNGFNDFLSKPIDTLKLNVVLEKWIPKYKQKKPVDKNAFDITNTIDISGVDTITGIAMTGGNLDNYIKTLTVFHKDGVQKIDEIKQSLETNDLPLYIICVHALKSVLASIGAKELSESAKALEAAGNQKDMGFIGENNDYFLIKLEALLINIKKAIPKSNIENQLVSLDLEMMKDGLHKLKSALEELDSGAIDSAGELLQTFIVTGDIGEAAKNILQNIFIGEYDEALDMIDMLLKDI